MVALSSYEAKYIALKEIIKELLFLRDIFLELGINTGRNIILIDSRSVIELANNPKYYAKTKYIDI